MANSLGPRPTDKAKRLTVVPYSPSLPLKTPDTGILLLAVFTLELETDYPSETSLCTTAPSPQKKNRRGSVRREGGVCTQASLRRISVSSSSVKTVNNKIPVSSLFNGSEGLYGTTVSRFALSVGLIISRG